MLVGSSIPDIIRLTRGEPFSGKISLKYPVSPFSNCPMHVIILTFPHPVHEYPIAKPTDTRVYVWGLAATGALGVQTSVKKQAKAHTDVIQHPSRLNFAENRDIVDVAAGYGFSVFAAKCRNGKSLWGTGINTDAQIGYHKLGGTHRKPFVLLIYPAPIDFTSVEGHEKEVEIVKVAAGRAHTLALAKDGVVYAFGSNAYGQCGREIVRGEDYFNAPVINRIRDLGGREDDPIVEVDCGQDHSFFLTASGRLYSCGWSDDGQTGQGRFGQVSTPSEVEGDLKGEKICKVTGTSDTVLALTGELIAQWSGPRVSTNWIFFSDSRQG